MITTEETKFLKRLGLKLRSIRIERGWTLEQSEEHGWPSWRHLQKLEAGQKNMNATTLLRLAKLYRIKVVDLLDGV